MSPKTYVDFINQSSVRGLPDRAARLVQALHHQYLKVEPKVLALAFPDLASKRSTFGRIRVWGEDLANLVEVVEGLPCADLDYRPEFPVVLKAPHQGGWVAYQRVQIKSRSSARSTRHNGFEKRLRRLQEAEQLPVLWMSSKSNGHAFSLPIKALHLPPGHTAPQGVEKGVNGYGLSTATRHMYLPDL